MLELLKVEIEKRYELPLGDDWEKLEGGDESDVYRAGSIVVRISPKWRTVDELKWVHGISRHCAKTIAETVAPIADKQGETIFLHEDYPISLFPFSAGKPLDENDDSLRKDAANLLCRIHQSLANWQGNPQRPPSRQTAPSPLAPQDYPPELVDPELDAWHANLNLTKQIIHGDFYQRNTLCEGSKIMGLIDWDEAHQDYLMAEIGWVAWELCQFAEEDDIDEAKAREFFADYFAGNPPLPKAELVHAIPFIRWRLRSEAVGALAEAARTGDFWDMEYTEREIRVFQRLNGRVLDFE